MDRRTESSGFTLGEVVVLILACMFALAIIVPMLARVRSVPNRITCGTKLAGIGQAMLLYANDYEDEFPRAGGRESLWSARTPNWLGRDRHEAFGIGRDGTGGQASISASLYLLVRYAEVAPRQFLCIDRNGVIEKGMSEFRPAQYGVRDKELIDLWDFGPNPPLHCSYAYHMVYEPRRLEVSGEPGTPVAADRNPWMDSPAAKARDFSRFEPDVPPFNGTDQQARHGNAISHQEEGQNVLFQDTHVDFEKRPYCGFEDDNIYTSWHGQDKVRGTPPELGSMPAEPKDSLLVNDPLGIDK